MAAWLWRSLISKPLSSMIFLTATKICFLEETPNKGGLDLWGLSHPSSLSQDVTIMLSFTFSLFNSCSCSQPLSDSLVAFSFSLDCSDVLQRLLSCRPEAYGCITNKTLKMLDVTIWGISRKIPCKLAQADLTEYLIDRLTSTIHPSIFCARFFLSSGFQGSAEASFSCHKGNKGIVTQWTRQQFITRPHRDKQRETTIHTHTPKHTHLWTI